MVKRSSRSAFMPSAHVFPGGRVDPEDASVPVLGGEQDRHRMGETFGAPAAAYQVAAVRETYEEAGILLAQGAPDDAVRHALQRRETSFGEAAERLGWRVQADNLVYWSWWITPEAEPRRYDTRFFVAAVDRSVSARHDDYETVDSAWWTIGEVLQRFDRGEIILAPPTWRTLWEMQGQGDVRGVLDLGRRRRVVPIMPRGLQLDDGFAVLLPGDPGFPSEHPVDGPTRITLRQGRWFVHR